MSTEYTPLKNKFFCNTCRVSFDKGRDAISQHERSQKHIKNRDRETKFMSRRKQEKTEEEKYEEEVKYMNDRNQRRLTGAPPQADQKKPKAGGPPGTGNRDSGYGTAPPGGQPGGPPGKNFQKKPQQKVEESVNRELGLSFKPQEMGTGMIGGAWTVRKDNETGKMVFYNNLSGAKHEERPRGVKLSPADEKKWAEYLENPTKNIDVILDPSITETKIGQWEEVAPEEDFYVQNQLDERIYDVTQEEKEDEDELALEERLDRMDELVEEEKEDLLNLEKQEYGKSLLRSKTDKLKKLVDSNFEAVAKPTFHKESDILFKRNFEQRGFEEGDDVGGKSKGSNLFKKRKVQGNENKVKVKLGFEDDQDE